MLYNAQRLTRSQQGQVAFYRKASDFAQIILAISHLDCSPELALALKLANSGSFNWKSRHDEIWLNTVNNTGSLVKSLRPIVLASCSLNVSSVLRNSVLHEASNLSSKTNISPPDLLLFYCLLLIAANPVGYSAYICQIANRFTKQLCVLSPVWLPILARALNRHYLDDCNYSSAYALRQIVHEQERHDSLFHNLDPFAFYAFGHQYVFLNFYSLFNTHCSAGLLYRVRVDPRLVANPVLLKDQIRSGFPVELIDVLSSGPSSYRGWDLVTSGPLREHVDESSRICDYQMIYYSQTASWTASNFARIDRPIPSRPPTSAPVKELIDKAGEYYVANWRTNQFKGETTSFNEPRNSNEEDVVAALLHFAQHYRIHIVIICQPSPSSLQRIEQSQWVSYGLHASDCSYADYLSILAGCSGVLTGMSGAWAAGSYLYNKNTLVFDCPWYVHPRLYNDFNTALVYKPLSADSAARFPHLDYRQLQGTADSLPHDGILLEMLGITFRSLDQRELYEAFQIFHLSRTNASKSDGILTHKWRFLRDYNILRQKSSLLFHGLNDHT